MLSADTRSVRHFLQRRCLVVLAMDGMRGFNVVFDAEEVTGLFAETGFSTGAREGVGMVGRASASAGFWTAFLPFCKIAISAHEHKVTATAPARMHSHIWQNC